MKIAVKQGVNSLRIITRSSCCLNLEYFEHTNYLIPVIRNLEIQGFGGVSRP